jgi:hypothetical protein
MAFIKNWPVDNNLRNRIRRETLQELKSFLKTLDAGTDPVTAIERYLGTYPEWDSLYKELHR